MTPKRLSLLREMLDLVTEPWTYDDEVYVREPVNFAPQWPRHNKVVDFPKITKVRFTLRKGHIAMFSEVDGFPYTPSFEISWIEAEGHVIEAYAFDEEGAGVAADMIGCPCPKYGR